MPEHKPTPFLFITAKKQNKLTIKQYFFVLWNALLGKFNTDFNMTVVDKGYIDKLHEENNDHIQELWDRQDTIQALRLKLRKERVITSKLLACVDDVTAAWLQDGDFPSSDGMMDAMQHLQSIMPEYAGIYRPEYKEILGWEYNLVDKQKMYDMMTEKRVKGE